MHGILGFSPCLCASVLKKILRKFQITPGFRGEGCDFSEKRREMALVLKAGAEADLDYWQIVFCEKLLGSLDPLLHQILLRREARRFSKRPCKMKLAQAGDGSDLGQPEVLFEIFVDEIDHTTEFVAREPAAYPFDHRGCGAIGFQDMERQRLDKLRRAMQVRAASRADLPFYRSPETQN